MCRAAALGAPGASRFHARLAMPAWALTRFARLLVRMVARLLPLAHPPLLLPPQAAGGPFTIVVGLAADATAGGVATDAGLNASGAAREGGGATSTGWKGGDGGDGSDGGGGGKVHGGTGWEGGKVHGGEAAAAAVSAAAAATVAAAAATAWFGSGCWFVFLKPIVIKLVFRLCPCQISWSSERERSRDRRTRVAGFLET
eukprot:scaffold48671_cov71-Phaeocystis_antarctica.AAC.5